MHEETDWIEGPAGRLFLRQLGAGGDAPLLMVHGGPDWDHAYLLPAARRLARRRRVALLNLRGCGRSDPPAPEGYGVTAAAGDVIAALDALGAPAHLLGFSFGGRVALAAMRQAPERLASLILASTTPGGPPNWEPEPAERARRRARSPDLREAFARAEPDAALTRRLAREGLAMDVWNEALLPQIAATLETVRFSGHWGKALKEGRMRPDPRDHRESLRAARFPRLVLHGTQDFRFPACAWDSLRDAPGLEIALLPDTGHLAPLETPAGWDAALLAFLDRCESGR